MRIKKHGQSTAAGVRAMSGRQERLLVTGADSAHHDLVRDLVASLPPREARPFALGFLNLGADPPPPEIAGAFDLVSPPLGREVDSPFTGYLAARLNAKARIPELFPGPRSYAWIDADCWAPDPGAPARLFRFAEVADIAIHPELDVHYHLMDVPSERTEALYASYFDDPADRAFARSPMLNAGVFAARADSPVWSAWRTAVDRLLARAAREPLFLSDQIPLHHVIRKIPLSVYPLRSSYNWQTYAFPPALDLARRTLVLPSLPHEPVEILHLAGRSKDITFEGIELPFRSRLRRGELLTALGALEVPPGVRFVALRPLWT